MAIDLIVPEVGESITEVQIGRWLKKEGEAVAKDEPLVEIETDKVTVELPAPEAGTLGKIVKAEGDEAAVGDKIGELSEGDGSAAPSPGKIAQPTDPDDHKAAGSDGGEKKATGDDQYRASGGDDPPGVKTGADTVVMPAARRLLDESGLDVSQVSATGPGGRVLKEDVQRAIDGGAKKQEPKAEPKAEPAKAEPTDAGSGETVKPMTPLRKTIAASLVKAQQTAALLTTFNEVDMTEVMSLRSRHKDLFLETHGAKLGFMSFFVKATVEALKAFPAVNAEVRGTDVVYKDRYDVGIAIGGGKGLVVPVLRDCAAMSFAQIESQIVTYAKAAQANKITLKDLTGGSFTITNGGVYGSLLSTPIVNPPQSGVLGMHGIIRRPIAVGTPGKDERVEVRPMMYLALTYDHRVVDGREAVTFLTVIKNAIEDPARMLLEL